MKRPSPIPTPLSFLFPLFALIALVSVLVFGPMLAQPAAQRIDAGSRREAVIDSLRNNFRVASCCAMPLNRCLRERPNCALAPRMSSFVDWLDDQWQSNNSIQEGRIVEMLNDHHATLTDVKTHRIETRGWPVIGDRDAPITVVLYYSITCPACKAGFKELYPAVTTGPLKGKARIVAKPLGNIYGNRALVAAHDMGRFADFKLALSEVTGRIDENTILDIADRLYFDRNRFRAMIESQSVTARVEQSTKDGNELGVERIPTYFIDGRRYNSTISPQWIIDAIDFAHEAKTR